MKRQKLDIFFVTFMVLITIINIIMFILMNNTINKNECNYKQYDDTQIFEKIEILENEIELIKSKSKLQSIKKLTITAYTPNKKECDSDPTRTASMKKVRPGIIAVSRDLFEKGWTFGKKVHIEQMGIYQIEDLMHKRHQKKIDILMFDKNKAKKFGVQQLNVALIK